MSEGERERVTERGEREGGSEGERRVRGRGEREWREEVRRGWVGNGEGWVMAMCVQ